MTILKISDELSNSINSKVNSKKHISQAELDSFVKNDISFNVVFDHANRLLEDNLFVLIKNIGFNKERAVLESFVKLFGVFYGAIEYTDIKMERLYTGCKYDKIELHNDDAIDLKNQPSIGFIQVLTEDPLKMAKNGIVKIDDIVNFLKVSDPEFLNELFEYKVPMLSFGINYDGVNKGKIITQEPILYEDGGNINVRFDLTRINFFYWKEKLVQTEKEKILIDRFLDISMRFRRELYLEVGDILIHKNKRVLHDRTECNFLLNKDGTLHTREIFVSFATN